MFREDFIGECTLKFLQQVTNSLGRAQQHNIIFRAAEQRVFMSKGGK
jgi:hypothetical protein